MATITKAQLQAEIEALRHNNELLRTQVESLSAELAMLKAPARKVTQHQPLRKIFEFDPTIPGDFARACALAKEFKGIARRVQAH